MTALEAYIESTRYKQHDWNKVSETVRESIIEAISLGKYCVFITSISNKDKKILEGLKYHVYWNDVYWCIVWDIKMK